MYGFDNGFKSAQRDYDNQSPEEICEDECNECNIDDCDYREEDYIEEEE